MSVSRPAAVIILAAGEGTRMKSDTTPKVLHAICGETLLGHVLATARETDPVRLIVVVGHRRREVTEYLASHAPDAQAVVQHRQGGTGHAVRTVIEEVGLDHGTIVVTYADAPLLRGATLAALVREHQAREAAATVLTARVPNPTGYGRIIRDDSGAFLKITEEADATPDERAVDEINSGVYAFEAHLLGDAVKRVPTDNAKGEEYLTDVIAILRAEGHHVASVTLEDPDEVLGVNDRAQLARARQIFNARLLEQLDGRGRHGRRPGDDLDRYRGEPGPRRRDRAGHPARGPHRGGGGGPGRPGGATAGHDRGRGGHRHPVRLPGGRYRRGRGRGAVRLSSAGQQGRCRGLGRG